MEQKREDRVGSLSAALMQARKLLGVRPDLAEEQAREILKVMPDQPDALLLLAGARSAQKDQDSARTILERLIAANPRMTPAYVGLGSILSGLGQTRAAIAAFSRAVELDPRHAAAWRSLGDQYSALDDEAAADRAYANGIRASVNDPQLLAAANALCDNRLAVAERLLREFLKAHPTDVAAMRMLAEVGARLGHLEEAELLLARALELAPSFTPARYNYALVLHRQLKSVEALVQLDLLLKQEPSSASYRTLRAATLVRIGEFEEAIRAYEGLLRDHPWIAKGWMSYGHCLKTLGRSEEGVAAYRKSIALLPSLGEAYWSLANLKTFRFRPDEIEAMREQLKRSDLKDEDRFHLDFALGKAMEDAGEYARSFEHYARANALRKRALEYDPDELTDHVRRCKQALTAQFFAERGGAGSQALDPIFIVSLPRAGSTLLEQILSSHSAIEGTMELQDINILLRSLDGPRKRRKPADYPEALAEIDLERLRALGEEYLSRARVHRKSGKPFFIDKMPNNFQHIGFIHLILPNAKIIDARRHPMACCFSNFKQHFARGQAFSYDQNDLGRFYRDYVELMAHFDAVLPGRVHRVLYERLIAEPESEIRALLEYCGLPFEEGCLRYYENERAVRTASSEQVRRPLYGDAVDHWRNYEAFLAPLRAALGPILDAYPGAPAF
ncbi:MAG TPA: sulfotransferase [Rhizomicrobium sp.]|nr:sulfotransferase [Rhizomicrobium sp.]